MTDVSMIFHEISFSTYFYLGHKTENWLKCYHLYTYSVTQYSFKCQISVHVPPHYLRPCNWQLPNTVCKTKGRHMHAVIIEWIVFSRTT